MRSSHARILSTLLTLFAAPVGAAHADEPRPETEPIPAAKHDDQIPAKTVDAHSPSATSPCRKDGGSTFGFAIGGSTMQIVLGPMLAKRFEKDGMRGDYLGKSASGLARYDYFDWPETVRGILGKHDPDVFVVAIGSNDGQSLRETNGHWFPIDKPGWREEYARRIDAFLDLLAGKDRHRAVIWLGPAAHSDDKKRLRGAVVGDVIRERVSKFDGRSWYIDLFARTSTVDGGALNELRVAGSDKPVVLRKEDGFHLARPGVDMLMYRPVLDLLAPCRRAR